jgi:hypothetical protein
MANTYVDYTATAGQTDFAFSFPFLEDSHVVVEVEGVNQTLTTNYTIETSPAQKIVLSNPTTALAGGELVRVKRVSDPSTDLVDFENGSVLTETELDRAYRHNRYLAEEAYDGVNAGLGEVEGSTNYNANNKQIKNLADGTLATDAVNKGYVDAQIALTDTNLAGFFKSTHTGNAVDNVFTLSFTPQTTEAEAYIVSIDGLVQVPDTDYTIGATDITFNTIPANSAEICVVATAASSVATVNEAQVTATGTTEARSLANRFADFVNVLDYGATGNGYPTDDSDALQLAINTGKPVYIPAGTYYVPSGASYAGAINVFGDGDATVLTTDGNYILFSTLASNSSVRDFRIERRTNPTTVVRDWGSWTTSAVGTTGEGYMPGVNDNDGVWAGLTSEQQNELGGWIQLRGQDKSSGTYGKNISVENISSKFGSILIENCEYVTVRGCRLHGERAAPGCITIKNYQARENGAPLAKGIVIDGNICEFSSFNGISVDGTDGAIISNNITGYCSETGIKLWQDGPGEPTNRANYKTIVIGNSANFNFEDGYNITSRYSPNDDTDDTHYQATGNYAYGNNSSGFSVDGKYNLISSNHAQGNTLDGITNNSSYSLFTGNYLKDNNASNAVSGRHEFTNNGVYNTIANNYAYRSTTRNGTGFYMGNSETLNMIGNTVIGPSLGITFDNEEVLNSIGNFANGIAKASSVQEFRSDASTNDSVNLSLTQASPSGNTIALTLQPRSTTTNPAGAIQCVLAGSTPGSEIGELSLQTAIAGTLATRAKIHYQGHFVPGDDNTYACGQSSARWSTIFAATGTINTSDKNEKQQIVDLSQAELQVATAIKGLIKKFKFNDAVEQKGDKARIHVGVIAQDVEQAFITAGLNPEDYGIFCKDAWWSDAEGKTYEEEGEGRTQHTRLGVRYEELFAFVISSL